MIIFSFFSPYICHFWDKWVFLTKYRKLPILFNSSLIVIFNDNFQYAGTINTKNVKVNIESDYIQPEHIIIDEQADNNFATVSYGEDIEGIPVADFGASNFLEINAELDKQIEEILVKNNGVWSCKVCGKFANHKSKLKQHVETHIEGFSHPCAICGKCYRSRNVLRMHLSRDHRNKKQNSKGSNNK